MISVGGLVCYSVETVTVVVVPDCCLSGQHEMAARMAKELSRCGRILLLSGLVVILLCVALLG